jgi:hypothetical protein
MFQEEEEEGETQHKQLNINTVSNKVPIFNKS